MTDTVHLDDASVNAVAERVAELLRGTSITGELVDASEVARRFSISRDFVYDHADEFGVVRLGKGSRARQRFDPVVVRERLIQMTVRDSGKEPQRANRNPVRRGGSSDLLPIKGD